MIQEAAPREEYAWFSLIYFCINIATNQKSDQQEQVRGYKGQHDKSFSYTILLFHPLNTCDLLDY